MSRNNYSWRFVLEATKRDQEEAMALKDLLIAVSKSESREFLILSRLLIVTLMKFDESHFSLKAILNKIKSRVGGLK